MVVGLLKSPLPHPTCAFKWFALRDVPRRFLVVPIVEDLHWSLAVVCNLDSLEEYAAAQSSAVLQPAVVHEDAPPLRVPCILFMDSLGAQSTHSARTVAANLRWWLQDAWRARVKASAAEKLRSWLLYAWRARVLASAAEKATGDAALMDGGTEALSGGSGVATARLEVELQAEPDAAHAAHAVQAALSAATEGPGAAQVRQKKSAGTSAVLALCAMKLVKLPVPVQNNGFDCGLYTLQYAEEVLARWPSIEAQNIESGTVPCFSPDMFTPCSIKVRLCRAP